ncbi:hypothetical protein ES703_88282 [subsurface metagenome]
MTSSSAYLTVFEIVTEIEMITSFDFLLWRSTMTYFIIVKLKKLTGEYHGRRREDKRHSEPPPDLLFHEGEALSKGTGDHKEMGRN